MPLFALPLAPSSTSAHSASTKSVHFTATLPSRKRKRRSQSPSPDVVLQDREGDNSISKDEPHPPAASTNPLSLTPAEILQYRLAGLELDEPLPSGKDFPHRGLPAEKATVARRRKNQKGKGKAQDTSDEDKVQWGANPAEDEEENVKGFKKKGEARGPRLRLQHLSVLTAIVNKCLIEGDIPRASRAWAMLIRAQVGGRAIDIRSSGYWGHGAELLIRSQENHSRFTHESDDKEEEEGIYAKYQRPTGAENEQGTKEGRAKAKDYFERLILQHPYKRQFHGSVNALDFWPSMVTWEIYGIQYEQKEAMRKIAAAADSEEDGDDSESNRELEENSNQSGSDDSFAIEERRNTKRRRKREQKNWRLRDEVRQKTLVASENLAARLDELMTTPPYSDSHTLLEIRAHIALYIGDLSVPEMPVEDEDLDAENIVSGLRRSRRLENNGADSEQRLLFRRLLHEHERGKRKQVEEHDRARKIVARIVKGGGEVDGFKHLVLGQDDDQEFYDATE